MAEKKDYLDPELYTNRELSWILFNKMSAVGSERQTDPAV